MAEYIKREWAIANVVHAKENHMDEIEALECTIAADVAPVVHGRWVAAEQPKKVLLDSKCVECASLMLSTDKYCPNCGARMDGE